MVKRNANNLKLNNDITKIIIGDSHVQLALNDKIIPNSVSFALASESYQYSLKKIQQILSNNPQIDTVIIGISYHNLSSYYDENFYDIFAFKNYFYLYDFTDQIKFLSKFNIDKSFITSAYKQLFESSYTTWKGGYEIIKGNFELKDSTTIDMRIFRQFSNCELSHENIKYLKSIIKYCNEKNIILVAVNTPLHPYYRKKIPEKFISAYNNFVLTYKLNIIDFKNEKFINTDFLPDGDHLSESGAIKASKLLNQSATFKSVL